MDADLSAITVYFSNARSSAVTVPSLAMNKDSSRREDLGAATAVARLKEPAGQIQMNCDGNFENVELGVIGKKKKIPRRIIHFVSGETMEEYSTDEDENDGKEQRDLLSTIDPCRAYKLGHRARKDKRTGGRSSSSWSQGEPDSFIPSHTTLVAGFSSLASPLKSRLWKASKKASLGPRKGHKIVMEIIKDLDFNTSLFLW
ncbi:protein FAM177A1 isoform X1 [Sminthopsis crassicaudata]|uniref:protein FAM177A1 isoform X1 n=1 Tax=Sminthopsis crassicaudata TaxID=9301 RepID=UPI003D6991DE